MMTPNRKIQSPRLKSRINQSRRGILTIWTIWAMVALGCILASVFNLVWIESLRSQARHCTDSAALAAGYAYLSDDMLRCRQMPFEHEGRADRCQSAAIATGRAYQQRLQLLPLTAKSITLHWDSQSGLLKNPAQMAPSMISVNLGGVESNPISVFFSGFTGGSVEQISVQSTVALENSPRAFRPSWNTSVPVLPFAICDQPTTLGKSTQTPGIWVSAIESGAGSDRFSWNNEQFFFEPGPDGLPEVTVTIGPVASDASADALVPINFRLAPPDAHGNVLCKWITDGVSVEDLMTLGLQEISFPETFPTYSLTPQQIRNVSKGLQSKCGEPFVVPLCMKIPSGETATTRSGTNVKPFYVSLLRPVAARIIRVFDDTDGRIGVVLQPCVMTTATAITAFNQPSTINQYIYSVRLIN